MDELPEDLRKEVYDFKDYLLQKRDSSRAKKGKFKDVIPDLEITTLPKMGNY